MPSNDAPHTCRGRNSGGDASMRGWARGAHEETLCAPPPVPHDTSPAPHLAPRVQCWPPRLALGHSSERGCRGRGERSCFMARRYRRRRVDLRHAGRWARKARGEHAAKRACRPLSRRAGRHGGGQRGATCAGDGGRLKRARGEGRDAVGEAERLQRRGGAPPRPSAAYLGGWRAHWGGLRLGCVTHDLRCSCCWGAAALHPGRGNSSGLRPL